MMFEFITVFSPTDIWQGPISCRKRSYLRNIPKENRLKEWGSGGGEGFFSVGKDKVSHW